MVTRTIVTTAHVALLTNKPLSIVGQSCMSLVEIWDVSEASPLYVFASRVSYPIYANLSVSEFI